MAAAVDLSAELYHAVAGSNSSRLQQLIEQGADVDEFYEDATRISSKSILHISCEKGKHECVKVLIDAGAQIAIRDRWGQTPLMYCMQTHYFEIADTLLSRLPEHLHDADRHGKTAIHSGAESGSVEGMQVLLDYGADFNCRNNAGDTPLMLLCSNTDVEDMQLVISMMLGTGVDLELREFREKKTALQTAVSAKNCVAVEALIGAGANVNTLDVNGRTPLTNIMRQYVRVKGGECQIDPDVMTIIILLTQAGADLNLTMCEYSNPLIVAAFLEAEPLIHFFSDNGANPNIRFPSGVSPLLVSAIKRDMKSAKALLYWSADPHLRGRYSKKHGEELYSDAFELCLEVGFLDLARLLVNAGYNTGKQKYLRERSEVVPENLKTNEELLIWLQEQASNPMSLFLLTSLVLRKHLGSKLPQKVPELPLPAKLKDAVLMKHILC